MTRDEAQSVLLQAFIATQELPRDVQAVLQLLIDLAPRNEEPETESPPL